MPGMQTPYSPSFPGMIRIMGTIALLVITAMIGHECGKRHRSPYDMAQAALYRVQTIVEQPVLYFRDTP